MFQAGNEYFNYVKYTIFAICVMVLYTYGAYALERETTNSEQIWICNLILIIPSKIM